MEKNILVVYYSRSGHTETVAKELAALLNADLEPIREKEGREGLAGYVRSALEALLGMHPMIERSRHRPQDYDLVVLGTPIWFWNMSSPVRSFLRRHRTHCRQVALFSTMGGSGADKAHSDMARRLGQKAVATLALTERDVLGGRCEDALSRFAHDIRHARSAPAHKPGAGQATT
jgi:flavodoxin